MKMNRKESENLVSGSKHNNQSLEKETVCNICADAPESLTGDNNKRIDKFGSIGGFLLGDKPNSLADIPHDKIEKLSVLTSRAYDLLSSLEVLSYPDDTNYNKLLSLFGNYFSKFTHTNEQKTEMLRTQEWLFGIFNLLYRNSDVLTEIVSKVGDLCYMFEKYEEELSAQG